MDVTSNNIDRGANEAHQAVDAAADKAARKAGPVIDRVAQAAHQTVDRVADAAGPAADWVSQSADQFKQQQDQLLENARSYVRERPLMTIGMAVAAGYLVGRLGR